MKKLIISYRPAGRTIAAFHADNVSRVKCIRGPIGSSKSVACCQELFRKACRQEPHPDGVRRTKWAVVRNSYPELKTTTLETWLNWFPSQVSKIKDGSPIYVRMKVPLKDGTTVDMRLIFFPLERPEQIRKLMSLEVTGFWMNEAQFFSQDIIENVDSRVGRYPNDKAIKATWKGVIMDTNAPNDRHWWKRLEQNPPDRWRFFVQPPAVLSVYKEGRVVGYKPNPEAENVRYAPGGMAYWMDQTWKRREWIQVFLQGEYGSVFDGQPVYSHEDDGTSVYCDDVHWSPTPLEVYKNLPLRYCWDFGLTPACLVFQLSPHGQFRLLREYCGKEIGLERFVKERVLPGLKNDFPGMKYLPETSDLSTCDPAGKQRSQSNEKTLQEKLYELDFPTQIASTNNFPERRAAVVDLLSRLIDGKPGFVMDPSCTMIREGFRGGYKYKDLPSLGQGEHKPEPDKNMYSHPHDALQYGALSVSTKRDVKTDNNADRPSADRMRAFVP